jgi:hypothetical protein
MEAICEPYTYEGHDPLDLLLYRGKSAHIRSVLVDGEVLLDRGRFTRIDREEVIRKLREAIPEDYQRQFKTRNRLMKGLRGAIAGHFQPWYDEIDRGRKDPYYLMNNRI